VTLPLAYNAGPATQALKVVRHGPLELAGLTEAHQHIVAFTVLDNTILGQGSIGNPAHTIGAAFRGLAAPPPAAANPGALRLEPMTWAAWVNNMPMQTRSLHVAGQVLVPNPGIIPRLQRAVPQGFNPAVLLLDLVQHQLPGIWPQVVVPRDVDYVEEPYGDHHTTVSIVSGTYQVATVEIEEVH